MKRRDAIKNTAIFLGAVSMGAATSMMQSCQPGTDDSWKPAFLSMNEANILAEISETILPKTDTPGAKDAQVSRYLDEYGAKFLNAEEQEKFKKGIAIFENQAQKIHKESFVKLNVEQREKVLTSMINDISNKDMNPASVFFDLRDAVNMAFFTSEVGATSVLDHMPIPGDYIGDLPLSETKGKVIS